MTKSKKVSFDYIVDEATCADGLTIKETAQFHYFNKHGVYEAKKLSDDRISAAVDAGLLKSGAVLAYGSMNDFWTEQLLDIVRGKRSSRFHLQAVLKYIREDIEKADAVLARCVEEK